MEEGVRGEKTRTLPHGRMMRNNERGMCGRLYLSFSFDTSLFEGTAV